MIEQWFPDGIPAQLLVSSVVILVAINVILITIAYSIYLERKISAYIQDRIGPNRVGFDFGLPFLSFLKGKLGLGQPLADGIGQYVILGAGLDSFESRASCAQAGPSGLRLQSVR